MYACDLYLRLCTTEIKNFKHKLIALIYKRTPLAF